MFVGTNAGTGGYELVGGRRPRLRMIWQNGVSATSPIVSGGLVFAYDQQDGKLIIRQPFSGAAVRSLPVATGHWNSPIAVGGRVIVPEGDANQHLSTVTLDIFHLPGR